LPLTFKQDKEGLHVNLPEHSLDEMAYALKISFNGKIPILDKYADINTTPHYYFIPGNKGDTLVAGSGLLISKRKNQAAFQWKIESSGKGFYKIINRENNKALTCINNTLALSNFSEKANQLWKIENAYYGLYKISNKQYPSLILSVNGSSAVGNRLVVTNTGNSVFNWQLEEVCDLKVQAFKSHTIPGTIEAEDFNTGCPGEAYSDRDELNFGGEYRTNEGVDIEKYDGGYDITRTAEDE